MVWNFGMGQPSFTTPRQESQTVDSFRQSDWDAYNSDWQSRYNSEAAKAREAASPTREYLPSFAWSEGMTMRGGPWAPVSDMGRPQFSNGWQSEAFGPESDPTRFGHDNQGVYMDRGVSAAGYVPDFAALNAEKQQRDAEFASMKERQTRQQQAYGQQLGGGFAGGIIDASYSNPFQGQITGADTSSTNGSPAMPWNNQPWGVPGYGGPTGGQSIGGYSPTGTQGSTQGTGGLGGLGGWGGVFGAKNPWSPA